MSFSSGVLAQNGKRNLENYQLKIFSHFIQIVDCVLNIGNNNVFKAHENNRGALATFGSRAPSPFNRYYFEIFNKISYWVG